jgi:hypothetical protein
MNLLPSKLGLFQGGLWFIDIHYVVQFRLKFQQLEAASRRSPLVTRLGLAWHRHTCDSSSVLFFAVMPNGWQM